MTKDKDRAPHKNKNANRTAAAKPAKGARPGGSLKKAFEMPRDSVYVADPIADLCICGGKGVLPLDESGPLDTEPGPDLPVQDMRRIRQELRPQFKAEIDRESVRTPIVIMKIDGMAIVVAGKKRVRAARASNRKRLRDGRPPMRVRCVMQRETDAMSVLGTVIAENNAREDDQLADKVEKLRAFLKHGASEYDASVKFNVGQDRIRDWLSYDDDAITDVKRAVDSGQLPASTGMELAKIKTPGAQREALQKLLATPGTKDRSARAARALARGTNESPTATDRRSQRLLLAYVQDPARTTHAERSEFWRGVAEALKLVTGGPADPLVVAALTEARTHSLGAVPEARADPEDGATPSEAQPGAPAEIN